MVESADVRDRAESPDKSTIENMSTQLKGRHNHNKEPPKVMLEVWERAQAEWNKIEQEIFQRTVRYISRPCEAVIKAVDIILNLLRN